MLKKPKPKFGYQPDAQPAQHVSIALGPGVRVRVNKQLLYSTHIKVGDEGVIIDRNHQYLGEVWNVKFDSGTVMGLIHYKLDIVV